MFLSTTLDCDFSEFSDVLRFEGAEQFVKHSICLGIYDVMLRGFRSASYKVSVQLW